MLALVAAVAIRLVTGFVGVSLAVRIVRCVACSLHSLLLLRSTGLPYGAAVDISSASCSSRTWLLLCFCYSVQVMFITFDAQRLYLTGS